ncbi:RNase adapter RapZ [Futiania mangrovi]|uniref:RNase adapter RapZ n=1 Tax=Futiania mangrovi TaxID=2959716 RepID=A0A9J6PMG4_9PROT|nr:RNase adapter RapZ [Futiania mangrovii]MCP1337234.1 RNase adapter RapZ [Futiania mangrovii]
MDEIAHTPSPEPRKTAEALRLVVVTGLSGAGKTSALRMLEDIGFEAIDNLPVRLLGQLLPEGTDAQRPIAVGIDARTEGFDPQAVRAWIESLRARPGVAPTLLYMDCDTEVLARRFTETRRRHPLALDRPVPDGIVRERALIGPLRDVADLVLETTDFSLTDLRREIAERFETAGASGLLVSLLSFSYKGGLPREADMVFDVRFLDNPHWVAHLRPLTGRDAGVAAHVAADPAFPEFLARLTGLIDLLVPRFRAEGKSYLTLAIGCTGGRHRSVFVAERLAAHLREAGVPVVLRHRELP